ncbi:MAG: hypothetical protein Phog2KO_06760 [Phototrophicaceae bacterium]
MELQNTPFLNIDSTADKLQKLRIRLLQSILIFIEISLFAFAIVIFISGGNFLNGLTIIPPAGIIIALFLLVMVSRGKLLRITSLIIVSYLIIISVNLYVLSNDLYVLYITLALSAIVTALLLKTFSFWSFNILSTSLILGVTVADIIQETSTTQEFLSSFLIVMSFGLIPLTISIIAKFFVIELEKTALETQQSLSMLGANADIGETIFNFQNLNELLERTVNIIKYRFNFYHVSLFLTDKDKHYSHLTASTGEIGERMLANEYRLLIDSNSVVGRSTQAQDIIVVRNIENESGYSYNELLQGIRAELAVPIVDKEGVIGVIHIQSVHADAFTVTEIEALQVIANQLATAIRNARLFEDKENSIRENKRLFLEAETNLREIQRLNRQLTKQAWTDYLQTDRRINGVTWSESDFQNRANWSDEMLTASQKRRAITEEKDGIRTIALPIELRGEVVGAIEIETDSNKNKDDVIDMVQAISQRLGVSLDNARLFEESNEATAQEQRISEIVAQYQSADSVDELLRLTVKGLAETLGADHASIRLGVVPNISTLDDADNEMQSNNGDVSI